MSTVVVVVFFLVRPVAVKYLKRSRGEGGTGSSLKMKELLARPIASMMDE